MDYLTYEVINTKISVFFTFGLLVFMMGLLLMSVWKKEKGIRNLIGLVFLLTVAAFLKAYFEAESYEVVKMEEKYTQQMIQDGWEIEEKEGKIITFIKVLD